MFGCHTRIPRLTQGAIFAYHGRMKRDALEPAASIVALFGGPERVAQITQRDTTRVYRWMRSSAAGGTDGEIPKTPRRRLMEYAQRHQIQVPPGLWVGVSSQSAA